VGILIVSGLGAFSSLVDLMPVIDHFEMLEEYRVQLFVLAHVVMAIAALPNTVLVIVGGAVFGLAWGTLWSAIGATLGAIAAFWMSRYLMRDWVERRFNQTSALRWMNHVVTCNALTCVLAARFTPISPFTVVNFLFGLTAISFRPYAIGTAIGILPGTLAYTWLGVTGEGAIQGEAIPFLSAIGLLVALTLLPPLVQKWRQPMPKR
jgi:uncharacterized membrane protein YdjX (TVP38/TMEM64 family)